MSNFHSMWGVWEIKNHKIKKNACPLSSAFLRCPPLIIVLYTGILSIPMQVWCNWFKNNTEVVYMSSCLLCPYLTSEKKTCHVCAALYHKGQLISCDLPVTSCLGLGRRCLCCFTWNMSWYLLQTSLHLHTFTWRWCICPGPLSHFQGNVNFIPRERSSEFHLLFHQCSI